MYEIGEIIAYSSQGICSVEEITARQIGSESLDYYVLKPFIDSRSTVYVPVNNEKLTSYMRAPLTEDEAQSTVLNLSSADDVWLDNDNERRRHFNSLITGGDFKDFAAIYTTLSNRRDMLEEKGKKLRSMDETFLKQVEKLMCCELGYALNLTMDEVKKQLLQALS